MFLLETSILRLQPFVFAGVWLIAICALTCLDQRLYKPMLSPPGTVLPKLVFKDSRVNQVSTQQLQGGGPYQIQVEL